MRLRKIPLQKTGTPSRRRVRAAALGLFALLLIPLLSGCLRVQVTMGVSSDDLVTGHIVAATIPRDAQDKGPQLTAPSSLSDKTRTQPYDQDGYVGTEVYFNDLTFGELRELGTMTSQGRGMFDLNLKRAGDTVTFSGTVDLRDVAKGSDIELTINFPARVATTNGTRNGDNGVTWKLPTGEQSTLHADSSYADPHRRSFTGWLVLVFIIAVGAAGAVTYLAWKLRDRSPKPGDPQPDDPQRGDGPRPTGTKPPGAGRHEDSGEHAGGQDQPIRR